MRFTKMQGIGNDYIYIYDPEGKITDPSPLSVKMSDRHFGVGGDGLVLILPSRNAEAGMRMFNADGSEAEMCGNAIRCVAKYLRDNGLTRKKEFSIETKAGLKGIRIVSEEPGYTLVEVDMGRPVLESGKIPVAGPERRVIDEILTTNGREFEVSCVSMGNPHCVIFTPSLTDDLVFNWGPLLEKHPLFPAKTNVEFVQVVSEDLINMRVWERGSGETLACGTGACASMVAGRIKKLLGPRVTVKLLGGELKISWEGEGEPVYMTGPAVKVFDGEWPD